MPKGYKYGIYDTVTKEYMPGPYQSKEVKEITGITGNVSDRVRTGGLLQNRYFVSIVGEWEEEKGGWSKEWDEARMKLLRLKNKKKQTCNRRFLRKKV